MPRGLDLPALLARLDQGPADALETETLDFKSWDPHPQARKSGLKQLCEDVVCFANQRGGTLVLGVADRQASRDAAVRGVGGLTAQDVRVAVYRGTDPSITVDVETFDEAGKRLLLIHVPQGMSPPHSTTEGVSKIRVGKDCQPLSGSRLVELMVSRGGVDRTAIVPAEATFADLDPDQIAVLRRMLTSEDVGMDGLAHQADAELLDALSLQRDGRPTLASLLLLGTPQALSRFASTHELQYIRYRDATHYDVRHDLRGPLLAVLDKVQQLLESHLRLTLVSEPGFLELTVPDITWPVAREAVLNAFMHRDWFLGSPIQVRLYPDRIEVSSPGGFPDDVSAANVLRHAPVRRNPLLADVFQRLGFVNRAGQGVDRMYEGLLRHGKAMPRYEDGELSVCLMLPTRTNEAFARFVAEETRAGTALALDDLILLRLVIEAGTADRWSAGRALQIDDEAAVSAKLAGLRERGYLVPHGRGRGTSYRLAPALSDRLRGRDATDVDLPFDEGAVALRVQAVLAERGRLSNADVRRMTGWSRPGVVRLMQRLRGEGLVALEGRGRAAAWVPGPRLARQPSRGRRHRSRE